MGDIVRGSIEEPETAIDYLKNIAEKYKESDIAEGARLSKMFNELKFSGEGNVRDHLLSMIEINQKLRDLDIGVKDEQVVHMGLQSLPIAYSNLRSMYNAQDKKWDLNKLISVCCEEQERIKKETPMILLLEKPKEKKEHKYKPKKTTNFKAIRKTTDKEGSNTFKYKCYFCKKVGHMKKECSGFKAWMAKKGSPIHITTSLQGMTKGRKPRRSLNKLFASHSILWTAVVSLLSGDVPMWNLSQISKYERLGF
ncbi:hypothetical protein OSB04_031527 [Centaurea solstitialis]|uniref:CCHC-type domain-containing protein n=1 Tax=Centaurea solstitialis TaxID=347529 RepID=A0AA38SAX0_9ASTR|nr:hypothetical protein OSB04_031527 [Centaurea solstitialis]